MTSFVKLLRTLTLIAAACVALTGFALADSITGVVTNRTTNKPSAGDDVVLIRLAQGMQESSRTKTDKRGRFALDVPDPGMHLVRVTHDKANYFHPVTPGTTTADVDVFNAAAKVSGITAEADVIRLQTEEGDKNLRVVENFFIKNMSSPPMTQFSDRPFEFYLPAGAIVEGSAALGPGGMPVQAAPVPLGDANHFAFIFPIRPCASKDEAAADQHCGETRFQITYKVPYSGSLTITPRLGLATDTIAVMMPKSMTFKAAAGAGFSPVNDDVNAQTQVARNVSPSQPMSFTVSGAGQLPRETTTGASGDAQGGGAAAGGGGAAAGSGDGSGSAATDTRPGGGLGKPIDPEGTNDPWAKYKWWIIGGLGLVLAAGAGLMLKNGGPATGGAVASTGRAIATGGAGGGPVGGQGTLLAALKDELFALETDRLQGKVSDAAYAEQKAALEVVLRRALSRKA